MMDAADFANMMEGVVEGDNGEQGRFMAYFTPVLTPSATRRLNNNPADVAAVIGRTFAEYFVNPLPATTGEEHCTAHLLTICSRRAGDCVRSAGRRTRHEGRAGLAAPTAYTPTPGAGLEAEERREALFRIMRQADEDTQDAFLLGAYLGLTNVRAAQVLRLPPGTLKTKLKDGREQLSASPAP